ncbi:MAG: MT-A70 family methyltransferase [Candidatus Dormiibacterota bacterium]
MTLVTETPARVMAMIAQAREELQRIEDPREAASFVDRTDAIRYLAEKAGASQEVQNQAAEVAIRAKRRAGELLAAVPQLTQGGDRRSKDSVSLDSFGVQPSDSKRWQAVASVPEERFERHLAETQAAGQELTTAGVIRVAKALDGQRRRADVLDAGTPEGKYRCLVIDPPWPMQRFIEREVRPNQGHELPYPTMTIPEIAELPIPDLADPLGCHVYLWVTHRFLPDGLRLLEGWGVNYQCVMTWVKNVGFTPYSWMHSTEHVLFGRIGSLDLVKNGLRLDFAAPTTGHSRKPDAFYERCAEASPEPRLEMFARSVRPGFVPWGNQVVP